MTRSFLMFMAFTLAWSTIEPAHAQSAAASASAPLPSPVSSGTAAAAPQAPGPEQPPDVAPAQPPRTTPTTEGSSAVPVLPSALESPATPQSAPVVLSPNAAPETPPGAAPELRELRVTPTAKGGPGDPASVAAGPGGFGLSSHDKQWQIRFRALVQADGRFWFDNTQRPEINTFLIRRAQPYIEGSMPYGVSFLVNPDFGGGTTVLQDAYLGLDLDDALRFRFGKFRPPFGLERLQPTSNLSFVEFGLPTLLTPNRDVGAMVHGDVFQGIFGYAGGIFNGVPDNGSADLANDSPKEFAGRAYFRPFRLLRPQLLGRLFVGVSTTFGRVHGNPTNTSLTNPASTPAYKTPGQINDFTYIAAASGTTANYANTVVANGPHNRYGAYLYEAIGPLGILGEYYISDQEVGRAGYANTWVSNHAYQAQATFLLFGAQASYDFVHVETPVEPAAGHFGALEIAGRVGHLGIDRDAFPNFASPTGSVHGATEVTAGINYYWSDNAKFVVNWDHTEFQGGASTPAELAIGHREAENIIFLRAQVGD
jgi:phosphate-selective porin OprO/OprP